MEHNDNKPDAGRSGGKRRPVSLFRRLLQIAVILLAALILLILAAGFMAPIVGEYAVTGLVPRFPTLIVCGFVGLSGVLSLFTGMILKVIDSKDRKDFEVSAHKDCK